MEKWNGLGMGQLNLFMCSVRESLAEFEQNFRCKQLVDFSRQRDLRALALAVFMG